MAPGRHHARSHGEVSNARARKYPSSIAHEGRNAFYKGEIAAKIRRVLGQRPASRDFAELRHFEPI